MTHRLRSTFCLTTGFVVIFAICSAIQSDARNAMGNIPKWHRWELTLKSSTAYTNPIQEAEMRVLFVSPLGETNRVYGFWDGGKTWRVRFKPTFPGRWQYYTMCSDTANAGLNGKAGEFLCTAPEGESRFDRHGPVHVARDQKHLEHADHTPFFWLGDAAWLAAAKSSPSHWQEYVTARSQQKFNVVQWQMATVAENAKTALFTGRSRIAVNPEAFQKLDAKVTAANKAGLLSAIAPLWEIDESGGERLPEDQAIRLLRYAVARWGADDVAWIVAFECDSTGAQATRWQNIGRAVFNLVTHAPVVLLPGESVWAFDAFRRERWADIFGLQTVSVRDDNSLPWLLNGPLSQERRRQPARPLIAIAPPAEEGNPGGPTTIDAEFGRRLLWWSALLNTPAGVSYSARNVAAWIVSPVGPNSVAPWREALTLPGSTAMAPLAEGVTTGEFWELQPSPQFLTSQPGQDSARRQIAAVATEDRNFALVYVPESETISLSTTMKLARAKATWLNPRTGETLPALTKNLTADNLQFTPPDAGDWLLILTRLPEASLAARGNKSDAKIDKARRD